MSIGLVCQAITDELRKLPGIAQSHDVPPEQFNEWPAVVVYPGNGTARLSTHSDGERGTYIAQDSIVIEIHDPLKGEGDGWDAFRNLPTLVRRSLFGAFVNDLLPGVVTLGDYRQGGASAPLQWQQGTSAWGGVETRVMRFTFDVAIEEGIYP